MVQSNIMEAKGVSTLRLINWNKVCPHYVPGQFITVYFPETNTPEGKAYSISSSPKERLISITVKAIGEFSNSLVAKKTGDRIIASLPYGFFYSESEKSHLVMVAAGIGIAPFRSMIISALLNNPLRKMTLFYSNKTLQDIIFRKTFDELQNQYKNFKVNYFITREKVSEKIFEGRITGQKIIESIPIDSDTEFLICGSISFTRDIWRDLRSFKISEEKIYTEAFFSH